MILGGVSVWFREKLWGQSLVGPGWTAFRYTMNGFYYFFYLFFFKDPLLTRYACSYVLTPLCWELPCLFCSFQHALLPPCIQSFTSPAQSSLLFLWHFFSNLCPIWGYVYDSGRIFDQALFWSHPSSPQTLCHTYHCHDAQEGYLTTKHFPLPCCWSSS